MREVVTYIIDSSTVAIVEPPYEADDHGIEHHTVSPITFRGESSPKEDARPLDEAPKDISDRIVNAYDELSNNNRLSSRVIAETAPIFDKPTQDI